MYIHSIATYTYIIWISNDFHPLEVVSRYRDPQLQVAVSMLPGDMLMFTVNQTKEYVDNAVIILDS